MSNPHTVVLGYGPQGNRQSGASILLSYSPLRARRTIVGSVSSSWSQGRAAQHEQRLPTQHANPLDMRIEASWGRGQVKHRLYRQRWFPAQSAQVDLHSRWDILSPSPHWVQRHIWGASASREVQTNALWGEFTKHITRAPTVRWPFPTRHDHGHYAVWGQYGALALRAAHQTWATARCIDKQQRLPWWRFSRPLAPGWGVFTPDIGIPTDENGTVLVPILKSYIVNNSITMHRLDTGAELHAHGFSMSLDYQSWTWQWSASLHHDAEPHLGRDAQGDPPVVVVNINGIPFRLRIEKKGRDRRFNPTSFAVSGRGLAATLASPSAPTMSFNQTQALTAQQLANQVLTINGAPLGWGVDWQLQDWLVPANAWAFQGSYIEAINDIAGAAGGYVQPHPTDAVLRILPKYPAAPWHWATELVPDFELPKEVGEIESTEYLDKPAYNGIYVGGHGAGVFGPMIRAGTTGNTLAPQVLHPLITDAVAHSQRGIAELSDTGEQEHISLTMQVLPETGVIVPGKVVRYIGHDKVYRGIVRGTSIGWNRPVLRQTLRIETHA